MLSFQQFVTTFLEYCFSRFVIIIFKLFRASANSQVTDLYYRVVLKLPFECAKYSCWSPGHCILGAISSNKEEIKLLLKLQKKNEKPVLKKKITGITVFRKVQAVYRYFKITSIAIPTSN